MQIILHPSGQEQSTGNSDLYTEPNFEIRTLVISIIAISVNVLGSITFKLQHSIDGSAWTDVPNVTTGAISNTGTTNISISPVFPCCDNLRLVWTFTSANSVTFSGIVLGNK